MKFKQKEIWTIGHSTRTLEYFVQMLHSFEIKMLVDIRSFPGSKRHPHFNKENLVVTIPQNDISYVHLKSLGGRRQVKKDSKNTAWKHPAFRGYADYMETESFRVALESLLREANEEQTAIMCSESLWWRCHRRLISDAVVLLHNIDVHHLFHTGKLVKHIPTQGVRVLDAHRLRYDVTDNDSSDR